MVSFGGWEMPVQYSGIRVEHQAVREQAGLFDISHMGEIVLEGSGARQAIQHLTCNDLEKLPAARCQYTGLLTPEGTFVDDIIVYPLTAERILLCVNASNTNKDFEWIRDHIPDTVTVRDESSRWCQLALQGPKALSVLQSTTACDLSSLPRFGFTETEIGDIHVLLSRTGYTGEDGFELYAAAPQAAALWTTLMESGSEEGLLPCGLGARDTLRLESCYPLYGHEIGDTTNPYEAGLGWIVKLDQDDFIGKAVLQQIKASGPQHKLINFSMEDRGIPRQDYSVFLGEQCIGTVVSGTLSPTLDRGIGRAFVTPAADLSGGKIDIDIRGKKRKATLVPCPFYKGT